MYMMWLYWDLPELSMSRSLYSDETVDPER